MGLRSSRKFYAHVFNVGSYTRSFNNIYKYDFGSDGGKDQNLILELNGSLYGNDNDK